MRPPAARLAGAAYGSLAVADVVLAAAPLRWQRARVLTKPLLMPVLTSRGGPRVLRTAQVLSGIGDVALMRAGRRSFLAGLSSFLAAHVAYVVAFRDRSSVPLLATPGRRRALAAGGTAAAAMAVTAGRADRSLAAPVAAYGVTLAAMAVSAAAVDPDSGGREALLGALLFLTSDSLLGVRTFLLGDRVPVVDAAVMATYTAAQWWIAEGLASDCS